MPLLKGGYPIYGIPAGIIMLDCQFPRPIGDIGNALTFSFPVHYEILEGIPSTELIYGGKKEAIDLLVEAAKRLEKKGVKFILTSCGLLIRYQKLLANVVKIPVLTSSLLLLSFIDAFLPKDRKIGIITADDKALNKELLEQIEFKNWNRVVIQGMEGCNHFRNAILEPTAPFELDTNELFEEVFSIAKKLMEAKEIGVILLECTNLAPYSEKLRKSLSIPIFDVTQIAYLMYESTKEGNS